MKERPYIYVVLNDYHKVISAFYERSSAERFCQEQMAEQILDPRDWDDYYEIQGVQCN